VRRVFVDTSAFFAHLVAEDAHHPGARALFERADREAWTLITTNAVVWETYTLIRIRARNGRELALGFLEDIQDGLCDIERVRPVDETRAIDLLRRYIDKKYSFAMHSVLSSWNSSASPKRWASMTISGATASWF
jgi:predicted nucleic acid-binding protein